MATEDKSLRVLMALQRKWYKHAGFWKVMEEHVQVLLALQRKWYKHAGSWKTMKTM